ncbi:MAG: ParB/RepB/Spo0J family partition protein [Planctomycetota bacterium]|jgi:ParB-like chromosome segregation protein Spo0J
MSEDQRHIPIDRIEKPKAALRPIRRKDAEYIELVESVKKDGVLQPVLLRPSYCVGCKHKACLEAACPVREPTEDHGMVEGWHRLEAAREAGRASIPALIEELTDRDVLIVQIKCNAIRPRTRTFEYARRLKLLMEEGFTKPELAKLIDKSPSWIDDQLCLNRLCEEARAPVERGEIGMQSALALANLPSDLQPKFLDDAIAMKQPEFVERAKAANRDFKEFLLQERLHNREIGAAPPTLRAINVLKREAVKPKNAKEVLKAARAKTALDGWRACLAWVFKLDPISVENRKAGKKEDPDARVANNAEYHQLNREMIRQFVKPQSETGDSKHGK